MTTIHGELLAAVQLQFVDEEVTVTAPVLLPAVNVVEDGEIVYEQEELTVLNVAVTDITPFIVIVQVPVPEQVFPDQPAKVEPEEGVAVSVTLVPLL